MVVSVLVAGLGIAGLARSSAGAATPQGHLDVVQVGGLIDPIQVDFLERAITSAEKGRAVALVVQLNSGGGVISQARQQDLAQRIRHAGVPVAVWVGPNGSRAESVAYAIFGAAALRGMAPGTRVGRSPDASDPLAGRTVDPTEATRLGVATLVEPTLGDFVVNLDGSRVGDVTLHTAVQVKGPNGEPRRSPDVAVRFEKLNLVQQLLHTAASPSVAYLMLLIGLLLVVLEFFTAGIGIGAFCGAGAVVLASYGFGVLPFRGWALALLVVGVFGFSVDLQAGVPRVWTAFGVVAITVGSLGLYRGVHLSILALLAGVVGTPLLMVAGVPAMVRARLSTPTIGRQSLVGELGVALSPVEPDGTVEIRGAPWRARTNRATPIATGDPVRVVSIDGLLLEVEPEEGGARDAHH